MNEPNYTAMQAIRVGFDDNSELTNYILPQDSQTETRNSGVDVLGEMLNRILQFCFLRGDEVRSSRLAGHRFLGVIMALRPHLLESYSAAGRREGVTHRLIIYLADEFRGAMCKPAAKDVHIRELKPQSQKPGRLRKKQEIAEINEDLTLHLVQMDQLQTKLSKLNPIVEKLPDWAPAYEETKEAVRTAVRSLEQAIVSLNECAYQYR